jgi:hypothetical protein
VLNNTEVHEGTNREQEGLVQAQVKRQHWAEGLGLRKLPGLKAARDNRGYTVRELDYLSGVNYVTISRLERGLAKARPATVEKLADALDVHPLDLYTPPEEADEG